MKFFSERLKELRLAAGYSTARDFTDKYGFKYSSYLRFESGEAVPRTNTLIEIANALGTTPNDLLGFVCKGHQKLWEAIGYSITDGTFVEIVPQNTDATPLKISQSKFFGLSSRLSHEAKTIAEKIVGECK